MSYIEIYYRLRRINEETSVQQMPRRRSNSLPIPKIEVSIYQSPESKKKDVLKDFIEVPDTRDTSLLTGISSCRPPMSISRRFFFLYRLGHIFRFSVSYTQRSWERIKPYKTRQREDEKAHEDGRSQSFRRNKIAIKVREGTWEDWPGRAQDVVRAGKASNAW